MTAEEASVPAQPPLVAQPAHEAGSAERDTRDLHRGVLTNFFGYLLKLGNPVLLVFVVRTYGAAAFGLFTFAQAIMLFAARIVVYGFDKGLLWWIPRQTPENKRNGVRPSLLVTTLLGIFVGLVVMVAAQPAVLRKFGADPEAATSLRLMAIAITIQAWMDVLVHAALGMRRMAAQVFAKETVVPGSFVVSALALHFMGQAQLGLSIAFLISNLVGLAFAAFAFERAFKGFPWPKNEPMWPHPELVRYSGPMWLSEMSNSFLQRIDIYAVGMLTTDLTLVGVYAVVTRFSNAIRSIRRSFDPIVLAIVSEISALRDGERLARAYSHATFLVSITQIPVFALMCLSADLIAPWFGHEFVLASTPLVILSAFWLVNGAISLAGIVVSAYGYSRLTLMNVIVAAAALALGCYLLIPPFQLIGAALAVGIAYTIQGMFQLYQMRSVTGSWNYRPSILVPFRLGLLASLAAIGCWLLMRTLHLSNPWFERAPVFAAFAAVYGQGVHRLWRAGELARS